MYLYSDISTTKNALKIPQKAIALAGTSLNTDILKEFWKNFSYQFSEIEFRETTENIFVLGEADLPKLGTAEAAINISIKGISIIAKDAKALTRAFIKLIDRFKMSDDGDVYLEACNFSVAPTISNRMVHFCIFPDTKLCELEKFIRFCGALCYTHIILEFWGMYRYKCLPALAWSHAFGEEEIKPLIKTARELGMDVIPMMNHWGHASMSRVCHGKHVVLDNDPSLQYLFTDDGWCWNIKSTRVRTLQKEMRKELCELCGDGEYFHIGCDEAYGFEFTHDNVTELCNFINEISNDMKAAGRRIIMWGDMLVNRHSDYAKENKFYAFCPSKELEEYITKQLDKNIIIGDWQYECKKAPVETSVFLSNSGFDVISCPYDMGCDETNACFETVTNAELFGIMHTTWHTLALGTPHTARCAMLCFDPTLVRNKNVNYFQVKAASLIRKASPSYGSYENSGWSRTEIF